MSAVVYEKIFRQFLHDYWGAFHEVLEAQSIMPTRLADSLFRTLLQEHALFAATYFGTARTAVDRLGTIWREVDVRRSDHPDSPLTHEEVVRARGLFQDIYDDLLYQGREFQAAAAEVLRQVPHSTPAQPLRADPAF